MKKRTLILFVILIILICVVIKIYGIPTKEKTHFYGTTVGNMSNHYGMGVEGEISLYLSYYKHLYCIRDCDDITEMCIIDEHLYGLNYKEGWLYGHTYGEDFLMDIVKIKCDGSQIDIVEIDDENCFDYSHMIMIDDELFYVNDDYDICKTDLDGNINKVGDFSDERDFTWLLIPGEKKRLPYSMSYTEYSYSTSQENGTWIYMFKWNEDDVYKEGPYEGALTYLGEAYYYYPRDLYCASYDGSIKNLIDNDVTAFNVGTEYLYYVKSEDEKTSSVWRADLDGSNMIKINEIVTEYNAFCKWLYVSDSVVACYMQEWLGVGEHSKVGEYFIVNTDGSKVISLDEAMGIEAQ